MEDAKLLEKTNLKSITIGCVNCLNEKIVDKSDDKIFSLVAHTTGYRVMVEKWLHLSVEEKKLTDLVLDI